MLVSLTILDGLTRHRTALEYHTSRRLLFSSSINMHWIARFCRPCVVLIINTISLLFSDQLSSLISRQGLLRF